ncbi:Hypothetical predicted protein [Paramuricea clavata]|uniref:Uncharacterized protein n=1 Tax=Paramuricea clavata TaxID=317549 RepID=A0A6S7K6S1_PARCT|nr:Hypothetical predicted protein [Paramuricea clavata]
MKMAGTDPTKRKRKELDMPQRTRHEKDVLSIVNTLQNMVNPFETDTEITDMIHLSSGLVATPDVKADLLRTQQRGEECVTAFLKDRLLVSEPDIFSTIPKLKLKTFSSMAKKVKVSSAKDRYPDVSIKNLERNIRASGGLAVINIYGADQKLPAQWDKFLKHGRNKEALIRFLFEQWCTYTSMMFSGIVVYVCHDDKCHSLKPGLDNAPNIIREIATLSCDHEEADTRMLLHANHASQSHGRCDSTNSFYGRSKISTWKLVSNDETALDTFVRLGWVNSLIQHCLQMRIFLYNTSSEQITRPQYGKEQQLQQLTRLYQLIMDGRLEIGNIDVVWMTKKCAPDVLLKDCNCKCKTGCSTLRCSCKKANNQCNEMCQCVGCTNCPHESSESGSLKDDSEDDLGSDMEEENL